jgi:hypothetical protein
VQPSVDHFELVPTGLAKGNALCLRSPKRPVWHVYADAIVLLQRTDHVGDAQSTMWKLLHGLLNVVPDLAGDLIAGYIGMEESTGKIAFRVGSSLFCHLNPC